MEGKIRKREKFYGFLLLCAIIAFLWTAQCEKPYYDENEPYASPFDEGDSSFVCTENFSFLGFGIRTLALLFFGYVAAAGLKDDSMEDYWRELYFKETDSKQK